MALHETKASQNVGLKQCFIIGPFGEDNTSIRRWSDALTRGVIRPLAAEFGYYANRSIDQSRPRDITLDMLTKLITADLVVADLTSANANVYYELAVRHAVEKPFIHVIREGETPPFDISKLEVLFIPLRRSLLKYAIDTERSIERLRPYFAAVESGTASYTSILSSQQIGHALSAALKEINSFRMAQEDERGLRNKLLPERINGSITKYVHDVPAYLETLFYDVSLTHDINTGNVTYECTAIAEFRSISKYIHAITSRYPYSSGSFKLQNMCIDGTALDLSDPSLFRADAIVVQFKIPPLGHLTTKAIFEKTFRDLDSEIFTSYTFPVNNFCTRVTNRSPDTLDFWLEMLNTQHTPPRRESDVLEWKAEDGILPNQGVRLLWRPKDET